MDLNIGKKLDGRYEITELIGIGGMADVYKAVDLMENRTVAVKILKNEFSGSEEFLRRFRNESKAIAVLSHPNIVKIYDLGFSDEIQYIVMEYIDGITLKEFMEQQGALRWKDALHFITQVLRALQHAHDRGIVHRDIKPQNIMIFADGTVKVMDFGIARFSRVDGKTLSDKTIGSVHYISPEQARGDITDERSDIYSVGVMLYEMLTGTKPFDGDNPVAIALMHMQETAPYPRDIVSTIPAALEEIVVHAMEKNPAKRYQSAAEMIKDIDTFKMNPTVVFGYMTKVYAGADESGSTRYFKPVTPAENTPYAEEYEDDDEYYDDEEVEEKRSYVVPILAASAVGIVIIAAVVILITILSSGDDNSTAKNINVPNFVGMSYEDAVDQYSEKFNLKATEEYNSDYDSGIIFEQDVKEGKSVAEGKVINLTVSKGAKQISAPDVVGEVYDDDLVNRIKQYGFGKVIAAEEYSDEDEGKVIRTNPAAGEDAAKGSSMTVYVSKGPASDGSKPVPNVVDMEQQEAIDALKAAGFENIKITEVNITENAGKVITQSPTGKTYAKTSDEVELQVSTGKEVTQTVKIKLPIPEGVDGTFEMIVYKYATKYDSQTLDEAALIAGGKLEFSVEGEGDGEVTVKMKNAKTGKTVVYAKYKVDYANQKATQTLLDEDAFLSINDVEETTTTTTAPPATTTTTTTTTTPAPTTTTPTPTASDHEPANAETDNEEAE